MRATQVSALHHQIIIAVVAFLAGLTNAVAGGGTFFTFPALVGIAGLSEKVANMTSTIGLLTGSAASIVAAKGEYHRIPRGMLVLFGIISLVGGVIGAVLLRMTSVEGFRLVIPWLLGFATLVFGFSKPIARWAGRKHGDRSLKWTLVVAGIQVLVAIYGGYFGAGIGILMLAGLSFAGLDDIHQMNALKVLLATLINGVAAVIFLFGEINWPIAIVMSIASSLGGFLGIAVARKMPQGVLRAVILVIAIGLTAVYFVKVYA